MRHTIRRATAMLSRLAALGAAKGDKLSRHSMYAALRPVLASAPTGRVLALSRSEPLAMMIEGRSETVATSFPEVDLLRLPFTDGEFDVVVADQVLEHIEGSLQRAVDEALRVLRPGGWAVFTTCVMNPLHDLPGDFWRVTPQGLSLLFSQARVITAGSWGGRGAVIALALGLRRELVPERRWHPLHRLASSNDPTWPIVTWVVAEKPEDVRGTSR